MTYQHPNLDHEAHVRRIMRRRKHITDFIQTCFAMLIIIFCMIGIVATVGFIVNKIKLSANIGRVNAPVDQSFIVWTNDKDTIDNQFKTYYSEKHVKIQGFAQPSEKFDFQGRSTTICPISAGIPKNEYDKEALAVLGHEVLHCFSGQFHDQ